MNLPPETKWANGQPIKGPSPAHYMDNDSRRGFAIALQRVERFMEFSYRDGRPGRKRIVCQALLVAACDRKKPTNIANLRPLALFVMN